MTIRIILPSRDPSSGFCAASARQGFDVQWLWDIASEALVSIFALTPVEVRDLLDSDAGRILANDIGFIEGGPTSAEAIEALIRSRLRHLGWWRLYERAISEVRAHAALDPRWSRSRARRLRPGARPALRKSD